LWVWVWVRVRARVKGEGRKGEGEGEDAWRGCRADVGLGGSAVAGLLRKTREGEREDRG